MSSERPFQAGVIGLKSDPTYQEDLWPEQERRSKWKGKLTCPKPNCVWDTIAYVMRPGVSPL